LCGFLGERDAESFIAVECDCTIVPGKGLGGRSDDPNFQDPERARKYFQKKFRFGLLFFLVWLAVFLQAATLP
jgi:hypothetical protein